MSEVQSMSECSDCTFSNEPNNCCDKMSLGSQIMQSLSDDMKVSLFASLHAKISSDNQFDHSI